MKQQGGLKPGPIHWAFCIHSADLQTHAKAKKKGILCYLLALIRYLVAFLLND